MGYTPDIIVRIPLGMVHVEDVAPITGHPYFNRQKDIKQTGLVYTVYPGATHTRYEHVLETFQNTRNMVSKSLNVGRDITKEELDNLLILALLHDISHGPYSHQSEFMLQRYTGKTHTDIFMDVVSKYFKGAIEQCGSHLEDVEEVWKSPVFEIIDAVHGTDKLSYIRGDAFHTLGETISLEPLMTWGVYLPKIGFCIDEKGIGSLRYYLEKWYQMHNDVYWYKTVLSNSTLMLRAMNMVVKDGKVTPTQLMEMDDAQCNTVIESHSDASKLLERIKNGPRYWYKPIVAFKIEGHEISEVKERGKGVDVVAISRGQATKLNEVTNHQLEEIEQELFHTYGTQIFISATPQPERLIVRNPKIFSSVKGVTTLSTYDPAFFQNLEKKGENMWVARIIVPGERREEYLPLGEKIATLVVDRIK